MVLVKGEGIVINIERTFRCSKVNICIMLFQCAET